MRALGLCVGPMRCKRIDPVHHGGIREHGETNIYIYIYIWGYVRICNRQTNVCEWSGTWYINISYTLHAVVAARLWGTVFSKKVCNGCIGLVDFKV